MRKRLICVLMMTLTLSACSGRAGISEAEELALAIRGEYLEAQQWTGKLSVTADYGQRVYQYEMTALSDGEETLLTVISPENVAGITARITRDSSRLEYDGLSLETGELDGEGLTPLASVPAQMEAVRTGYITACVLEEKTGLLRMECGEAQSTPAKGRVVTLWFDTETYGLKKGEISVDGARVILCHWEDFVKN